MLNTGCPGIVLYARRRMGKSTVLRNLGGFLPPSVRPVTISMQDPRAFSSFPSFMGLAARLLSEAAPGGNHASPAHDLPSFFTFLDRCNHTLESEGRRILLSIDEYEYIDSKIAANVFPEDFLNLVRESIQSHRSLTWIFAGSHEINELTSAPWASSLVSARTIEIPMFTEEETHLLLTDPLRHSQTFARNGAARPRPCFSEEFWGNGGVHRVHREAGGWPHLVQLIAETVVDMLNDENGSRVDDRLIDRALDRAVVNGHNVFYELLYSESQKNPGEWDYVSAFRRAETQTPPADDLIWRSLRRRKLVVEEGGLWRLRVPMMQRWLCTRG